MYNYNFIFKLSIEDDAVKKNVLIVKERVKKLY